MAPALIPSYSKDLSIMSFGEKLLIESFYFFTFEADFLRADEYIVSAGEYQYYLNVYQLGCSTDDFFLDHGLDPIDMHIPMRDIANTLLASDTVDDNKTIRIDWIQFNDFDFTEENGQMMTGKQVKSAVIAPNFQPAGPTQEVYKMFAKKHGFLIYDNIQSIVGGAFWASSIIRIAEVRIYNLCTKKSMDILDPGVRGASGILSWSANDLSIDEVVRWGRVYDDENCCRHIVYVICKDRPTDNQLHDYVSIGGVTE